MSTDAAYSNWKAPFFTIWTGQSLSLVGSRVAMFALIWWVTETTGSATVLALATLFAMLPMIVLGPLAGAYVDRWNRRVVMIVADSAIALASLILAILFFTGQIQVWHVYAIMLLRELGGIFHWPAMQASTSLMVPKEHLARVSGLNQAMMGLLNVIGPALGALLLSLLPMHNIMLLDVGSAALAVVPLFFIAIPQPERTASAEDEAKPSIRAEMMEGARYLFGWRGLMVLTGVAMLFKIALTPAFSLLPILVTQHFGGQAPQLAGMETAMGIGLLLGGLLLGVWGGFKRQIFTSFAGLMVIGLAVLALGLLPATGYIFAVGAMLALGLSAAMTDGPLFAVLQSTVAPEMQGRVFMLFGSLISLTSPLGLIIAGPVSDAIGVQTWYIIGGLGCLLGGVVLIAAPSVRNLEDYQWQDTAQAAADAVESADTAPESATLPAAETAR